MSKEAKIKAFKVAFLKPKSPDRATTRQKTAVEKAVKKAKNLGRGDKLDAQEVIIKTTCSDLHKSDPEYYQELLTYKLTKHWKEKGEFDLWFKFAPSSDNLLASAKELIQKNPEPGFVVECWSHFREDRKVTEHCFGLAPDELVQGAVDIIEKTGNPPQILNNEFSSKVLVALFEKGVRDELPAAYRQSLTVEDGRKLATADPKGFIDAFCGENATNTAKYKFLKDREIREALAADAAEYRKLTVEVPMLAMLNKVRTDVAAKGLTKKADIEAATVEAVFDELVADGSTLPMTYYTNVFTPPSQILAGKPADTRAMIDAKRQNDEEGTAPDIPAAQCDELVTLLMNMVYASLDPGTSVKCKHIVIPGMVLTVELSKVPGGLLENTFGGNVYDDSDSLTGQVLFTGNPDGDNPDAHTYLEVGGTKFDAVLGTKGKQVTKAVAEQFGQWNKTKWVDKTDGTTPIWVAKSKSSGNYIVKQSGLDAAPNQNGFNTAYRLTTDPSKYAKKAKQDVEVEVEDAEVEMVED